MVTPGGPSSYYQKLIEQMQNELAELRSKQAAGGAGPHQQASAMQVDSPGSQGPADSEVDEVAKKKAEEIKEVEGALDAITGLSSSWAQAQKDALGSQLQRLRSELYAAKPLHAQAHILANKVRQQRIKCDKLQVRVQDAQSTLEAAQAAVAEAEKNHKESVATLDTLQEQLGALQSKLPTIPDVQKEQACMAMLNLSPEKLGELVSKAAEGTGIGQEAQSRLSTGLTGALREVFVSTQRAFAAGGAGGASQATGSVQVAPKAAKPEGELEAWKPDDLDLPALRKELQSFGAAGSGGDAGDDDDTIRERARQLARGGYHPKRAGRSGPY